MHSGFRESSLNRRQFLVLGSVAAATGARATANGSSCGGDLVCDPKRAVYLSDLDRCVPANALSRQAKRRAWRLLDYETESFTGAMLVATEESEPPDITYRPGRTGWHQMFIGIYRKPFEDGKQIQVKLSGDPAFTTLSGRAGGTNHLENWVDEIHWKTADLTGQDITFRQVVRPAVQHAWVAYVKLVPLSDEEVGQMQADRQRADTKRLFVHTDAHFINVTGSELELRNYLEPLRHTDVARVYWEAGGGDRALYLSKIARTYAAPLLDEAVNTDEVYFPRRVDRQLAETWLAYRRNGVDPLRVAAEFAHEIGLELHAAYRVGSFVYPPPHDETRGEFFREHPELACVARDGRRLPRVSYAFPETRRYVISLLREMTSYPIDGVCLLYNRAPPLVTYEAPLVQGFRAKHGLDPHRLDEHDPRWLAYRSTVLTQFMRELRQELDAAAAEQKRPKRFEISAIVFRPDENLLHGMDVETWIKESLVDTIIAYTAAPRLNSHVTSWEKPEEIAHAVALVRGTTRRMAANLFPRSLTPEQYRQQAHLLYQAGVENFFFWDGIVRVRDAPRLGHREEIDAWISAGAPPIIPTTTKLRRLGPWHLDLVTPG